MQVLIPRLGDSTQAIFNMFTCVFYVGFSFVTVIELENKNTNKKLWYQSCIVFLKALQCKIQPNSFETVWLLACQYQKHHKTKIIKHDALIDPPPRRFKKCNVKHDMIKVKTVWLETWDRGSYYLMSWRIKAIINNFWLCFTPRFGLKLVVSVVSCCSSTWNIENTDHVNCAA